MVRNVSDIYAMGGTPRWATLAMALPEEMQVNTFEGLLKGIKNCCSRYDLGVLGGDLSKAETTMLSMTVLGWPGQRTLRRSSARTGQKIYLTGPVGEAALGLYVLKSLKRPVRLEEGETLNIEPGWTVVEPLIRRACLPEVVPLPSSDGIGATIDISDGLGIDLWRLCTASGVGARIYWDRLPITEEMKALAEAFGLKLMEFVLSGGEDYQLLLTGDGLKEGFFEIGEVTTSGCEIVMSDGRAIELGPNRGYEHFRTL
ncbi:MAG: thiamine-phosphate kinase [Nitrospirae bacterium]|nr:MAG: thiamine-phosphate kinase [Nitrospirota bacterium]